MFRRILSLVLTLCIALPTGSFAQISQANKGNAFAALDPRDYNQYVLRSATATAAGAAIMTIAGDAQVATPSGRVFLPLSTSTPLLIDSENSSLSETVTPSAVTCAANGLQGSCTFTATFSNAHNPGASIRSGTAGICDAKSDLPSAGGLIVINPGFGGSTTTITASSNGAGACGATTVTLIDDRAGAFDIYKYNGSNAYVKQIGLAGTPNFAANLTTSAGFTVAGMSTIYEMAADVSTTSASATPLVTWTIPASTAMKYHFDCDFDLTQATAATANVFSITTATNAPTAGALYGMAATAATAFKALAVSGYNATSATTILSVTPGAAATEMPVHLSGYIEQPSGTGSSAVTISVATTTGDTDITTIHRGGGCRLF